MPDEKSDPEETHDKEYQRRKTPTWVHKMVEAKDDALEAEKEKTAYMKDMATEQRQWLEKQIEREKEFLEKQLQQSFNEREARSKALYDISENDRQSKDITIKRLWIASVVQILIIAALAGVTVTGKLPFIGDIGLNQSDTPAKKAD